MAEPAVTALTPAPIIGVTAPTSFSLPPGPPQHDVIEALPERCADLLRKLRLRSIDSHAVVPSYQEVSEASADRTAAAARLAQLQAHPAEGGFGLSADNSGVMAQQKLVDRLTDDLRRLQELQQVRTVQWQSASAAQVAVEIWLRDGKPHGTVLEPVETEVKLNKGESVLDCISRLQRRGREVRATIHTIRSACFPSSYCKERMREQIGLLSERGQPSVARLVEIDGPVDFVTARQQSMVVGGAERLLAFSEPADAVALLAFLLKPTLIAALDHLIDEESDDPAALSHTDRELRESEAQGDLIDIEMQEAKLIWRAQDERLPVEFRSDCSPLAILQCRLVSTAATNGHAASSLMHAWDVVQPGGRR